MRTISTAASTNDSVTTNASESCPSIPNGLEAPQDQDRREEDLGGEPRAEDDLDEGDRALDMSIGRANLERRVGRRRARAISRRDFVPRPVGLNRRHGRTVSQGERVPDRG